MATVPAGRHSEETSKYELWFHFLCWQSSIIPCLCHDKIPGSFVYSIHNSWVSPSPVNLSVPKKVNICNCWETGISSAALRSASRVFEKGECGHGKLTLSLLRLNTNVQYFAAKGRGCTHIKVFHLTTYVPCLTCTLQSDTVINSGIATGGGQGGNRLPLAPSWH